MKTRKLGKTDVHLSEIALGTWGISSGAYGPVDPQDFARVVERALELEVTTFDMAPLWGAGEGERLVAKSVNDKRDKAQYVTRAGLEVVEGDLRKKYDRDALVRACESSLERLSTDRIDVWLLHNPDEEALRRDEVKEVVAKLKKDGKIRAWGASVSDPEAARLAIGAGADAVCVVHNLLAGDDLADLATDLAESDVGLLARSPLAYGLLTGYWSEAQWFPKADHRSRRWTPDALRQRVRQMNSLRFLVHDKVESLASAALRYVLSNDRVTSALVGARTVLHIALAARASDPPYLPEADLEKLPQVLAATGA